MQGETYPYMYRPQSLVAVQASGGSTYTSGQDYAAYFPNPQIREDTDPIELSDYSFVRYGPEIDGYWTGCHEGFQPPPGFLGLGHEDVPPTSVKAKYVNFANTDTAHTTHDSWPDHTSTSAFSDPNHPYVPVGEVPNFIKSPALGTQQPFSTAVGNEASSRSDEKPDKPFKCPLCIKRFALKQSVGRHYRKRHDSNKCLFSNDGCKFTWGGPYDLGRHLKGQHKLKNEVVNTILGKAEGSHCRAAIFGRKPFPPPLYITD